MKFSTSFLFRLVVIPFYKQHAGFFLFFFLLLFGIIPPQFLIATHAALIQAQLSSIALMLGVSGGWILYATKCLRFAEQTFQQYHHSFLSLYQVLPVSMVFRIMAICFLVMYLPVFTYGVLTLSIAIGQGVLWYVMSTTSLLVFTLFFSTYWLKRALLLPKKEGITLRPALLRSHFRLWRNIPLPFLPLAYLWSDKKTGILLLKLISYLSFNLFFIRNAAIFREDYFTFFIFLIGAMHALLIFNLHKMMEQKLVFLRQLPIGMPKRLVMIVLVGMVLFIPELIMMLISGFQLLAFTESIVLYSLLASQLVLLFSVLYTDQLNMKRYVQYIFLILLSYLFLYMLIPTILIVALNFGTAYLIFHEQYHTYEYKEAGQ